MACDLYAAEVQGHFPEEFVIAIRGYMQQKLSYSSMILKKRTEKTTAMSGTADN